MVAAQTLVAALLTAYIFELLRIPAGALIGAMVAVAVLNLTGAGSVPAPAPVQFLSFAGIGWILGQGINPHVLRQIAQASGVIAGMVVALILFAGLLAYGAVRFDVLDPATAFLATSPGGISQMSALAAAVGANAPLVATLHLARVVTVVILAPSIIRWLPSP